MRSQPLSVRAICAADYLQPEERSLLLLLLGVHFLLAHGHSINLIENDRRLNRTIVAALLCAVLAQQNNTELLLTYVKPRTELSRSRFVNWLGG